MFTFATSATAVGVLAGCSSMSVALYGAACTDPDQCGPFGNDSGAYDAGVATLYGGGPFDAASLDQDASDATTIDDAAIDDSGDAGEGGD